MPPDAKHPELTREEASTFVHTLEADNVTLTADRLRQAHQDARSDEEEVAFAMTALRDVIAWQEME